jgi:hypothetical protein
MDHEDPVDDEFPKMSNFCQEFERDFEEYFKDRYSHLDIYRKTLKKLEKELVLRQIPLPSIDTHADTFFYSNNKFRGYLNWFDEEGDRIIFIEISIKPCNKEVSFTASSIYTGKRLPYNRNTFYDFVEFLEEECSFFMDDKEQ